LDRFAKARKYKLNFVNTPKYGLPGAKLDIKPKEIMEFIKTLNLTTRGEPIEVRDYQFNAICNGLINKGALMICPTASGKSLIQYVIIRYLVDVLKIKVLLVVPTTALVEQMFSDFQDYGWDAEEFCHRIYTGKEKNTDHAVTITTWQSIYKLPKLWFNKYGALFGDESHLFTAKSLGEVMKKAGECGYRIGVSGTLDGALVHELVLNGHFGPTYRVIKTKTLQEKNVLSRINISVINLVYPEDVRQQMVRADYHQEINYIVTNPTRQKFVKNLAKSLDGNTLILFQFVEKHGAPLYRLIKDSVEEGRKVFFVHGGVDTQVREDVRRIVEKETNAIIVASFGTFSTGVNIRNLHNLILASPSKSQVRLLQSIGRGLRIADDGSIMNLFDLVDDLHWKKNINFGLRHSVERCKIYNKEEFPWKIHEVKL